MLALRTFRIRAQLLALLCVTPFVLHAAWKRSEAPLVVDEGQAQRSQDRAAAVAQHVDRELGRLEALLDSATVQLDRSADLSQASDTAAGDSLTSRISIALLDTAGNRVALLRGADALVLDIPAARRRDIVAAARHAVRNLAGTPRITAVGVRPAGASLDSVAVILARPVRAGDARCECLHDVQGALIIAITDGAARDLTGPERGSTNTVVSVLDPDGMTVAGTEARQWRWAHGIRGDGSTVASDTGSQTWTETGPDGVIRTVGHASVTRQPWEVFVGVPTLVAARVDTSLRDTVMLSVLALLLASAGLAVISRTFTRSMLRIVAELMPFAERLPRRTTPPATHEAPASADGTVAVMGDGAIEVESAARASADVAEKLALVAALAEFARATADQPELQSVALARLQQLAGDRTTHPEGAEPAKAGTSDLVTSNPFRDVAAPPTPRVTVTYLRINGDQVRFDTIPPTRV